MFFPDELLQVQIRIDNTHSQKDIQDISCTLTQSVMILRGDHQLSQTNIELKLVQF
jgi:hypothetical protein